MVVPAACFSLSRQQRRRWRRCGPRGGLVYKVQQRLRLRGVPGVFRVARGGLAQLARRCGMWYSVLLRRRSAAILWLQFQLAAAPCLPLIKSNRQVCWVNVRGCKARSHVRELHTALDEAAASATPPRRHPSAPPSHPPLSSPLSSTHLLHQIALVKRVAATGRAAPPPPGPTGANPPRHRWPTAAAMKQASINKFFGGKPPKAEDAPKASPAKKAAAPKASGEQAARCSDEVQRPRRRRRRCTEVGMVSRSTVPARSAATCRTRGSSRMHRPRDS